MDISKLKFRKNLHFFASNDDMTTKGAESYGFLEYDHTKPIREHSHIVRPHVMPYGETKYCCYRMSLFKDGHPWVQEALQEQQGALKE